jgi:hypothetical protein
LTEPEKIFCISPSMSISGIFVPAVITLWRNIKHLLTRRKKIWWCARQMGPARHMVELVTQREWEDRELWIHS